MHRKLLIHALMASLVYATTPYSFAGDVTTDGTVGAAPATTVVLGATIADTYDIVEALGERSGTNLFHSFLTFNIDVGETALFSENVLGTTNNVISRVTGGSGSLIDGTISNIAGANFWFVDTAGVIIGANAVFDVSGALSIGAVDYIDFGGPRFYALPANQVDAISTLTVTPTDFGFLPATTAGDLTITGLTLDDTGTGAGLEVGDITLAGNNVIITDSTIINDPEASGSDISINGLGDVTITNTALGTTTENDFDAGNITISGGSVALNDGTSITSIASGVAGSTVDPVPGVLDQQSIGWSGDITITGATGVTSNIDPLTSQPDTGLAAVTIATSANNEDSVGAGTVTIEASAGDVFLANTSINSDTITNLATVDGAITGGISVTGSNDVTLDDVDLVTSTQGAPASGDINTTATTGSLWIRNGSFVSTTASTTATGDSGQLTASAATDLTIDNSTLETSTEGESDAGDIDLSGDNVAVNDGTNITSTASGAAGSTVDPDLVVPGSIGQSGDISVTGATGATSNIVGGVPDTTLASVTISTAANNVDSVGAGTVSIEATAGDVFLSDTTVASTTITDLAGGLTGGVSVAASGDLTLDGVSVNTSSLSATDAGTIQLSGFDVALNNGTQLTARGEFAGSGAAGDIDVNAVNRVLVNVDPGSLDPIAGSTVIIDTSAAGASSGGSDLTISGGDVLLSSFNVSAGNGSTAVAPGVGSVSITAIGGGATAGILDIQNSFLNGDSSGNGPAPAMLLSSATSLDIMNTTIFDATFGAGAGGVVDIIAGTDLTTTGFFTVLDESFSSGNAGAINLVSGGDMSLTGASLQTPSVAGSAGEAGTIDLSAGGSLTLVSSTLSAPARGTGDAGMVSLSGDSLTMTNVNVTTTTASNTAPLSPDAGDISVNVTGAIDMTNSTLVASTTGDSVAGDISLIGTSFFMDGGQIAAQNTSTTGGTGAAGSITFNDVLNPLDSFTIIGGGDILADAGTDGLSATAIEIFATGAVQISGTSTDEAEIRSSASSGTAANINIEGSSITLADALISTEAGGTTANPGASIFLTATDVLGTGVDLTDTRVMASSSGAPSAGSIFISSENVSMSGGTLESSSSGTGNGGSIFINYLAGPVSGDLLISDGAEIRSEATGDGSAGFIIAAGDSVDVQNATLSASATGGASGFVALLAESGISITDNSSLSASAAGTGTSSGTLTSDGSIYVWNGFFTAGTGDIDIADSALNIDLAGNAQAPNSFIWVNTPGSISLTNTELSSTTTDVAGDAGTIAINGSAVTMTGGFLQSSTTGSGNAGDIEIEGPNSFFSGTPTTTGQVTITGGADIAATAGEGPGGTGTYGDAGTINIMSDAEVILTGIGPADLVEISSSSFTGAGQAGTINLSGTDLTAEFASLSTETASTNAADDPASISLMFTGDSTLNNTQVTAATSGAADAGGILITGFDISLNDGTQLRAPSSGGGAAGTIDVTADNRVLVNVDPVSLLAIPGGAVRIETRADGASSGAGDLTITGGDVLLSNINVRSNNNSTAATPDVGSVTITAIGGGATSGILDIADSSLNGDSGSNGSAPSMLLSSLTSLDITNTIILDATFGTGAGGVIDIIAGTDLTIGGFTVLDESFSTGNAGAINLSAGGDLSLTGSSLQTPGIGSGEAGPIDLSAGGSLTLASSSLSAPGQSTGDAGTVSFSGDSLTMTGVTVTTTTASNTAPLALDAGDIGITVTGAIVMTNSTLQASTTGDAAAGDISLIGTSFFMDGGQIAAQNTSTTGGTGAAGSITFNDVLNPLDTFTIIGGGDILADAGANGSSASTIQIIASGAVQISGTSTDEAEIRSSASSGTAANVDIEGSSITLADALISTEAGGTTANPGASIFLTATDVLGTGVDLTDTRVIASTSGTPDAGDINISGPTFQMSGGSLQSSTSGDGRGGVIQVNWPTPEGVVSITDNALLSASSTGAGDAGFMIIAGDTIDVQDSILQANATETDTAAGFVALVGDNGISVTNSTLTAISSGSDASGGLTGGSIYLLNGFFGAGTGDIELVDSELTIDQRPETPVAGDPGCPTCVPPPPTSSGFLLISTPGSVATTNTILSSTTSGAATAGDIFIEGADFTMTGGSLVTSTTGTGNAGNILIAGPNSFSSTPTPTGAVIITGGADISATAGIDGGTVGNFGSAGTIEILSDAAISLAGIDASNPVEISSSSFTGAGEAGTITLSGADLTTSFARLATETASTNVGTPASIDLQFGGGDVLLTNSAVLASSSGATDAGNITIDAASITVQGTLAVLDAVSGAVIDQQGIESSSTATEVAPAFAGAAGSILFTADTLTLATDVITSTASDDDSNDPGLITAMIDGSIVINGGLIEASTTGNSDAGSIELNGSDVLLDLNPEIRATSTGGQGAAGSISIVGINGVATTALGATINSSATGIDSRGAGSVLISAGELNPDGSLLTTANVSLTNANISSSTSSDVNPLTPGSVTIEATGAINIAGANILTESLAGAAVAGNITIGGIDDGVADPLPAASLTVSDSFISSSASGAAVSGSAGSILMQASTVDIMNGSAIESRQLSQSALGGASGTITIESEAVDIMDSSLSTATASNNLAVPFGGLISVTATNTGTPGTGEINLTNAFLESSTSGAMPAGDIFLSAENVDVSGGRLASSSSADGRGGNIFINYLTDYDTFSIGFVPGSLQISNDAQLLAEATGSGAAGFIIAASDTVMVENSTLSAAAQGGNAGFVAVLGESGISITDNSFLNASSAGSGAAGGGAISSNGGAIYVWNGFFTPGSGDVNISDSTLSVDLSGDATAFNSFIVLETPESIVLTDTTVSATANSTDPDGNAGDIYVNGSDFTMNGGSLLSSTTGLGDAGNIQIAGPGNFVNGTNASIGQVTITGGADIQATAGIEGGMGGSYGDAGRIDILSDSAVILTGVDASELVEISSSSFAGAGQAGGVTLRGADLTATFASLSTETASTTVLGGASLDLDFTGDISFADSFALASTSGATDAGNISFKGTSFTMDGGLVESSTTGEGDAGSISIAGAGSTTAVPVNTGPVTITGGADIRATAGEGPTGTGAYGDAGTIDIRSDAAIILAGVNASNVVEISSSSFVGAGQAGTVTLSGTDLTSTFVELSTETASTSVGTAASIDLQLSGDVALMDTLILASTSGSTSAGDVSVNGSTIGLSSNTLVAASSTASGDAGNVGLFAIDSIDMSAGTALTARSTGAGNAGSVTLDAGNLVSITGARVESSSLGANVGLAGSVTITGGDLVLTDATVTTATDSDVPASLIPPGFIGTPGAVTLISDSGVLLNGSTIETTTTGEAAAGDIDIEALGADIDLTNESIVTASTSGGGNAGSVSLIAAGAINLPIDTEVSAKSTGPGDAGSVSLAAGAVLTIDSALVTSSSLGPNVGVAGTVTLDAAELILTDAVISTETDSNDDISTGGTIVMTSAGSLFLDGTRVTASATGEAAAGSIILNAVDIDLANEAAVLASTSGGGNAGDVTLTATDTINLPDGMLVAARSTGAGNAGSVVLDAGGLISITGATVESSSLRDDPAEAVGLAGFVTIQGGDVTVINGLISTRTDSDIPEDQVNTPDDQPEPGAITLISGTGVLLDATRIETVTTGLADAGDIYIEALGADVDLTNESIVTASTSAGGDAGDVTLVAAGAINLPMNTEVSAKSTGPGDAGSVALLAGGVLTIDSALVTSSSDGAGVGTAGNVDLAGSDITITNALVSTQSSSDLDTSAPDDGVRPGTITVTSPGSLFMEQGSRLSASVSGAADGGEIFITASDLTLIEGSVIETRATGTGNSGSVTLDIANDVTLVTPMEATLPDDQSAILTNSLASQGGTITADIDGVLFMDRGRIESSVDTADGKGGDIVLTTNGLFMVGSQILARADQGNGGAIFINRGTRTPDPATDTPFDGLFIIDSESLINADSNEGVSGEVNIDSPDADLTAVVEIVDARIVEDPTLADDVCSPSTREAQSSFIVEDQGGVAPSPDGYFSAGVLSAASDTSQIAQGKTGRPADSPPLLAAAGDCE